jgi:enoyl-CoA hydratase
VNAFSPRMVEALTDALDDATTSGAVVLTGNAKCFTAGFDLSIMGKGPSPDAARLLVDGAELLFKLALYPRPLVMAVPGHALALGSLILLTGDVRLGTCGTPNVKIGANEVHIGMPMPQFGVELARSRLTPRYLTRAMTLGAVMAPEEAVEAGYLDKLAPAADLEAAAVEVASQLAHLSDAFVTTKQYERRAILERCRSMVESDAASFRGS